MKWYDRYKAWEERLNIKVNAWLDKHQPTHSISIDTIFVFAFIYTMCVVLITMWGCEVLK